MEASKHGALDVGAIRAQLGADVAALVHDGLLAHSAPQVPPLQLPLPQPALALPHPVLSRPACRALTSARQRGARAQL